MEGEQKDEKQRQLSPIAIRPEENSYRTTVKQLFIGYTDGYPPTDG
ncbi:MAG: hypothetical protein IJX44_00735 [Bacteroidaceae bacterium]|nr:hypothetical protein [Bacteroidaceae bacterium]